MVRRYAINGGIRRGGLTFHVMNARQILREDGPDLSSTRQMNFTFQWSRHTRHQWCLLEERQLRKPHQQRQRRRPLEWCQLFKQGVLASRLVAPIANAPFQYKQNQGDVRRAPRRRSECCLTVSKELIEYFGSPTRSPRGFLVSLSPIPKKPPRLCPHLPSRLPVSLRTARL
jgi:hypothetical protein